MKTKATDKENQIWSKFCEERISLKTYSER